MINELSHIDMICWKEYTRPLAIVNTCNNSKTLLGFSYDPFEKLKGK